MDPQKPPRLSSSNSGSIPIAKQAMRQRLKEIRLALSPSRCQDAAGMAYLDLYALTKDTPYVLSFASFGSEIDLWPLNEQLASEGRLVLPRIVEGSIQLFYVEQISHLEENSLGISEPVIELCKPIEESIIKVAFIPGLGFDVETKHRLGYGKGHYDRFLEGVLPSMEAWGVGFQEQAVEKLPYIDTDVALTQIYLY